MIIAWFKNGLSHRKNWDVGLLQFGRMQLVEYSQDQFFPSVYINNLEEGQNARYPSVPMIQKYQEKQVERRIFEKAQGYALQLKVKSDLLSYIPDRTSNFLLAAAQENM